MKATSHERLVEPVRVASVDELVYITAERKHLGVMISELDELGIMICRRCIKEKRVVEFHNVIYTLPTCPPCDDYDIRTLWIRSHEGLVKMRQTTYHS